MLNTAFLNRLWNYRMLRAKPYVIFDSSYVKWTSGAFTSAPNLGYLGGTFAVAAGTPTRAAADLNGRDALSTSSAGIYIPGVAMPAGNLIALYIAKRSGLPPAGVGMIAGQSGQQPGWGIYDQINITTTFTNGHTVHPGDSGMAGWPSGTSTFNTDNGVTPPADDGKYHISVCKIGTDIYWRQDGAFLTNIFQSTASRIAVTGDLTIGTSYNGQYFIGNTAFVILMPETALNEIIKLEGAQAWQYRLQYLLPPSHPYKGKPPLASNEDFEFMYDSGLYIPRRKLIRPDNGWRLAA